jgi:hypothetical protein
VSRARLREILAARWSLDLTNGAAEASVGGHAADVSRAAVVAAGANPAGPVGAMSGRRSARAERAPPRDFELDIPCALPFLALGPLLRIGYLAAVCAALEVAKARHLLLAFASALARKSLAPPERGWQRRPEEKRAAAAFAGAPEPVDDAAIADMARALCPHRPLLDAHLAGAQFRGHRAEAAWLLCREADGQVLVVEEDGLIPVALAEPRAAAVRISPSGSPACVAPDCVDAPLMNALDELEVPYATSADPGRSVRAVAVFTRDHRRAWVSAHGGRRGRLRALASEADEVCGEAAAAWRAIWLDRPALPVGGDPRSERSLALAASFALGAIAHTLWHERERTHPQLALDRFADLDARVRVTPEEVHVRLPLGKRFWDLRAHGMLADVAGVPWLSGRSVRFGAG